MLTIKLNKQKNIGKVLFVVEGLSTEYYLLHRIFTRIFNYQYEKFDRMDKYKKYNAKENIQSSVFVVNTEESAIKFVEDQEGFLDRLFTKLINDYGFDVDKSAIYYLFDRDVESNTNRLQIQSLIEKLTNSRVSDGYDRQGLLLMSYPAVESFVATNFISDSIRIEYQLGSEVKGFLHNNKYNQSQIDEETLLNAVLEMLKTFKVIGVDDYDLDHFGLTNFQIFHQQEHCYHAYKKYKLLSLLSIVFLDLRLIDVEVD